MDSDPPPSYNSVVKNNNNNQLRRRDQAGNELSETQGHREASDKVNSADNETTQVDGQASLGENHQHQEELQRTNGGSLWDRFKRGMEDLALFVIQILD